MHAAREIEINRRVLLVGGGAALAGLLVTAGRTTLPALWQHGSAPAIESLSAESLVPHIGSSFAVPTSALGSVALELIDVVATQPHPSEPTVIAGEAFSLLFAGSTSTPLAADYYALRHDALALPLLYLSPVGRGEPVQDYQVIVDHRTFDFSLQKEN
jgi:hypothetical protein